MQPLIDCDVILYEIGYAAEAGWEGPGLPSFDYVAPMCDNLINNICAIVDADCPPILYFTGKRNFRFEIAKTHPYKDRPSKKPWHYYNIKAYLQSKYEWRLQEGLEADDLMAIEQYRRGGDTIICTRDKDLRQVEGWSYGWECHNQPSFGPEYISGYGGIKLSSDRKKINGTGEAFFYSQMLTGDSVDTIVGLGGRTGPVKAFEILSGCTTSKQALKAVYEAYKSLYGPLGYSYMIEQGRLLYMTRKLREDGSPILWGQNS